MFTGIRPDLTVAQVIGLLAGGIPVVAKLLYVFGVYELSDEQQSALTELVNWAVILAGALFVSDAGLRAARNAGEAKIQAAAVSQPQVAGGPGELVSDEEEFANQPPDDPDGEPYDPDER
jgi:hypothetical protein